MVITRDIKRPRETIESRDWTLDAFSLSLWTSCWSINPWLNWQFEALWSELFSEEHSGMIKSEDCCWNILTFWNFSLFVCVRSKLIIDEDCYYYYFLIKRIFGRWLIKTKRRLSDTKQLVSYESFEFDLNKSPRYNNK